MKSVSSKVRRARPLLGTFVEITAQGEDESLLRRAVEKAFAAVYLIHQLMNFHDSKSDVGRLNSSAASSPVSVHPLTWAVLKAAKQFSMMTAGALDITVPPRWREKQLAAAETDPKTYGDWNDIILTNRTEVFFCRPLLIDLGGIAKGFAVDRATETLTEEGVEGGVVNAGGDLRVFGRDWHTVQIRHPLDLAPSGREIRLRERSLATSAVPQGHPNFSNTRPFVDGRTGRVITASLSATVTASDCMTADALTKAAIIMGRQAIPLLRQHGASALLLCGDSSTCEFLSKDETHRYQA